MTPPKEDTGNFHDWARDVIVGVGVFALIILLLLSPWVADAIHGAFS